MRNYQTVKAEIEDTIEIKRSKFICSILPVESVSDGLDYLKEVKAKYPGATHYCYAIIGKPGSNEEKVSDDGEPSGTAGVPIKSVLNTQGLEGIACVVTRYFGGIKLGAPGLISAYSNAVLNCLDKAEIVNVIWSITYEINIGYSELEVITRNFSLEGISVEDIQYGEDIKLIAGVPVNLEEKLYSIVNNYTMGKGVLKPLAHKYIIMKEGEKNENN
ncbi:MAG TPA: YigZ family protein [Clostridia bacterium]|jgi:uncharacterized YigZ family protein|nr:YigZ family protein [Clostridia bacterium]